MMRQKWTLALLAVVLIGVVGLAQPAEAERSITITVGGCTCESGEPYWYYYTNAQGEARWEEGDEPYDFVNVQRLDGSTWSGCGVGALGGEVYTTAPWTSSSGYPGATTCPNGDKSWRVKLLLTYDGDVHEVYSTAFVKGCQS